MAEEYQRIVYPERAEYIADETVFRGYRIFLDHWNDITVYLQECLDYRYADNKLKKLNESD